MRIVTKTPLPHRAVIIGNYIAMKDWHFHITQASLAFGSLSVEKETQELILSAWEDEHRMPMTWQQRINTIGRITDMGLMHLAVQALVAHPDAPISVAKALLDDPYPLVSFLMHKNPMPDTWLDLIIAHFYTQMGKVPPNRLRDLSLNPSLNDQGFEKVRKFTQSWLRWQGSPGMGWVLCENPNLPSGFWLEALELAKSGSHPRFVRSQIVKAVARNNLKLDSALVDVLLSVDVSNLQSDNINLTATQVALLLNPVSGCPYALELLEKGVEGMDRFTVLSAVKAQKNKPRAFQYALIPYLTAVEQVEYLVQGGLSQPDIVLVGSKILDCIHFQDMVARGLIK